MEMKFWAEGLKTNICLLQHKLFSPCIVLGGKWNWNLLDFLSFSFILGQCVSRNLLKLAHPRQVFSSRFVQKKQKRAFSFGIGMRQ